MEEHNQKNFAPILSNLKKEMAKQEIDAILISHDDEFLSFELQDDSQYLAYITGFTGSAGFACIYAHDLTQNVKVKNGKTNEEQLLSCPNAVFIDGRYKIQVTEQTDPEIFDTFNFSEVSPADWLCAVLESGQSVGVDLNRISYDYYLKLKEHTRNILDTLSPREASVLRLRFGIDCDSDHTLEEVGKKFTVTRERIRQIEAKALRKLRHPTRSRIMRTFTD